MIDQFPGEIYHQLFFNPGKRVIMCLQYTCQASALLEQAQMWQVFYLLMGKQIDFRSRKENEPRTTRTIRKQYIFRVFRVARGQLIRRST
jgi:hypothetical protein